MTQFRNLVIASTLVLVATVSVPFVLDVLATDVEAPQTCHKAPWDEPPASCLGAPDMQPPDHSEAAWQIAGASRDGREVVVVDSGGFGTPPPVC